jgi:hypothetical protein
MGRGLVGFSGGGQGVAVVVGTGVALSVMGSAPGPGLGHPEGHDQALTGDAARQCDFCSGAPATMMGSRIDEVTITLLACAPASDDD